MLNCNSYLEVRDKHDVIYCFNESDIERIDEMLLSL